MRRVLLGVVLLAALAWLTPAALAGGWASVTLDALPKDVRAGQTLTIGFMVRQHGQTPVNSFGAATLTPYLLAVHSESKTEIRADARQSGEVGHFEVEVTFPRSGAWAFKIIPAPFPDPTEIGLGGEAALIPLQVGAPLVGEPGGDQARAAQPGLGALDSVASAEQQPSSTWVWPATAGIIIFTLGLTLLVQRGGLRQRTTRR